MTYGSPAERNNPNNYCINETKLLPTINRLFIFLETHHIMNITDTLHDFFTTRPAVSVSGLALDSGVYRTTIYRSMNGERIKPESERRLREAMRTYGYETP
jgi:hypothetical protein